MFGRLVCLVSICLTLYAHVFLTEYRYFLFQASLVPVLCLRNEPLAENAHSWRHDIELALGVIESMFAINSSSLKCYDTIHNLCGEYLMSNSPTHTFQMPSTQESPQTQITNMYSMMWPNVPTLEADVIMQDEAWLKFLNELPPEQQNIGDVDVTEDQWELLLDP
jgi:transcriptional regulatory protein GAL4